MERAGHPVPSGSAQVKRSGEAVFRRFGEISEKEEEELLDYLTFLRSRSKKEERKK
jgi:HTH-type transcriptional regulator, competence development regulator